METIRISRLSGQEAKKNVQVEALVSSMEEAMTSNGKPYVKGVLSDRRDKVSFKVWDTTLADLTKKYGLPAGKAFVGCLSGNIDVYEGKPQLVCKGGITLVEREGAVDNYIDVPPYSYQDMVGTIDYIVNHIESEELKTVCKKVLSSEVVQSKRGYQPFSCEVHEEKMGWLHHTYNLLGLVADDNGLPKVALAGEQGTSYYPLLDKEVVMAAFVCYHLSSFTMLKADEVTGAVEEKDVKRLSLNGGLSGINNVNYIHDKISDLSERSQNGAAERLENLLHVIAVLNGVTEAATPEAIYARGICNLEKSVYKAATVSQTIGYGERTNISFEGEKYSIVRTV